MKNDWSTKKLGEIIVGIIFIISAVALFIKGQYLLFLISLVLLFVLLLVLLKRDTLKKLIVDLKSGHFEFEFQISEVNIKRDIEENNEPITKETFSRFKRVEEQVLRDIQKKLGGEMKRQIHFMYGIPPDRPEFVYTPDATIQTEKELIFLEIKYILKPEFTKRIVENAVKYLSEILQKFGPSAGKKLVAKLILASGYDLNSKSFDVPEGIEVLLYKL